MELMAKEILKRVLRTPQDLFRYSDKEIKIAIAELEALESRSCESCKYFYNQYHSFGLCNKGISSDFKIGTFYCNYWESK